MDWKNYEEEMFSIFKSQYPNSEITYDAKRKGLYSKTARQIDILIEDYIAGNRITIVIDCKYFNKKIDVKYVESFIGMLEDIGAHKGLLISQKGFSEAALNRAHYAPSDVELDILNFDDLQLFQSHYAIPYAGSNAVLMSAPFGWIIDAQSTPAWLAVLYQQGLTLDKAFDKSEFMYIQFWDRKKDAQSLDDLLEIQAQSIRESDVKAVIEYLPTIRRNDAKTVLRIAKISDYKTPEYSGFVEFEDFILFCVMFSPENKSRQNIRKLENILKGVLPMKVKFESQT